MLGVMVWSNPDKAVGVIWCEDHGQVAYLQGHDKLVPASDWPAVGDLVTLGFSMESGVRIAREVEVVTGRWAEGLPESLLAAASTIAPVPLTREGPKWGAAAAPHRAGEQRATEPCDLARHRAARLRRAI